MCMSVLSTYKYVHYIHAWVPMEAQERTGSPVPEVVNPRVGAGN